MELEKPTDIYTGPLPSDKRNSSKKELKPPVKPEPPLPVWVLPSLTLMGGFAVSGLGKITGPLIHKDIASLPLWGKMFIEVMCGVFTLLVSGLVLLTIYKWVEDFIEDHKKEKEDYQKQMDKYHQELRDYLEEIDRAERDRVV